MIDARTKLHQLLKDHPYASELKAPPRSQLYQELRAVTEIGKLIRSQHLFEGLEASNPQTIMAIPGIANPDFFTFLLRQQLKKAGHRPYGWGLGLNRGNIDATIPLLITKIEKLAALNKGPIVAIGWSLGGLIAREITRLRPDLVKFIFTMGTPIIGGPKYTSVIFWANLLGQDPNNIEERLLARYAKPIERPILAYYSKNDRVVDWQACIDPYSPDVTHIEVVASHFGMGFAPEVLADIMKRLKDLDTSGPNSNNMPRSDERFSRP
ncbi:MAG: hypothetical protein AAF633_04730 [Chloroflexota bacterium]